jgi:ketosteroid isomerase-like protein
MATQHEVDEAGIRRRIGELVEAVSAMDLDGVKLAYAPDMVSFDIVPPLQAVGAAAKWHNWADVFTVYQRPLGYQTRDLTVTVGDDVAFAHSLNRITGTLQNGNRADYWVRWTACFRKIELEPQADLDHLVDRRVGAGDLLGRCTRRTRRDEADRGPDCRTGLI